MNNRNIDFPVTSKRRKKAEEDLFRQSMGFDEEEAFQQAMGQQTLGELAQTWGRPVDTAIPTPTPGPTPGPAPLTLEQIISGAIARCFQRGRHRPS